MTDYPTPAEQDDEPVQRKRTRSEAITDDQLCALIEAHQSHSNITSYDIADRREALSYYLGEPFGDEVAGAKMRVGVRQIGMRVRLPRLLDDPAGAAQFARFAE